MRLLLSLLLLLPILAGPASADDAPPPPPPPGQAAVQPPHRRMTWQQHFAQANLAHDGHLTRAEATAGFTACGACTSIGFVAAISMGLAWARGVRSIEAVIGLSSEAASRASPPATVRSVTACVVRAPA